MNEIIALIYSYGRAAWRRRWWAVSAAWLVAMVAWVMVLLLPDRYEAQARVYVDTRTALQPILQGIAIQDDYQSQLSLVREALLSRPQLQSVARQTNLDTNVKTAADMDRLIRKLQQEIQVSVAAPLVQMEQSRSQDLVYTITYQHADREKSILVVRTLLDNFEEFTKSGQRSGAGEAQNFLSKRIADSEKTLREEEALIADFKSRNPGMAPTGDGGDFFGRLNAEMAGAKMAENNLVQARSRQSELQKQADAVRDAVMKTVEAGTGGSAGNALDVTLRKVAAEEKLRELRVRFKDNWPDVVAQIKIVEDLAKEEAQQLAELKRDNGGSSLRPLNNNPAWQEIQVELSKVNVEIASLQSVLQAHRREIAKLSQVTNQGPELEQEFKQLVRNYEVHKRMHEELVIKSGQTQVADEAARTGVIRFDTIDPPNAAFEPAWPNRQLYFAAALFAAIMAGIAIAILPHLIFPTFDDIVMLQRRFGVPVLGAISALRPPAQRDMEYRQIRLVVIAVGALVCVAGALLVVGQAGARFLQGLLA